MLVAVGLNAALIVGMWLRHGGLQSLGTPSANLTATGQLCALLGTYAALLQILLMSRSPWLEELLGTGLIARVHRWLGFSCVVLICAGGRSTT